MKKSLNRLIVVDGTQENIGLSLVSIKNKLID